MPNSTPCIPGLRSCACGTRPGWARATGRAPLPACLPQLCSDQYTARAREEGLTVLYAFVVTLREGLEAALILGILLAYLTKLHHRHAAAPIWAGTAAALGLSLLGALGVHLVVGEVRGQVLDLIEGLTMLAAVGILSYMVLWMQRQARHLKAELHSRVDQALATGSRLALAALAFTVVGREGLETAVFLIAGSLQAESGVAYLA